MAFLAEQHLVAAKLVRRNGAMWIGAERELFIGQSNSFVVCLRFMAKERGFPPLSPTSFHPGLEPRSSRPAHS
jgi:hypothetical protein